MHSAPDPDAPQLPWITRVPPLVVARKNVVVPVALAAAAVIELAVRVPLDAAGANVALAARLASSVLPATAALTLAGGLLGAGAGFYSLYMHLVVRPREDQEKKSE